MASSVNHSDNIYCCCSCCCTWKHNNFGSRVGVILVNWTIVTMLKNKLGKYPNLHTHHTKDEEKTPKRELEINCQWQKCWQISYEM